MSGTLLALVLDQRDRALAHLPRHGRMPARADDVGHGIEADRARLVQAEPRLRVEDAADRRLEPRRAESARDSTAALSPRNASIVSGESSTTSMPASTAFTAFSPGDPILATASMFIASV